MKKSSLILIVLFVLLMMSVLGSAFVLKGEYNKIDKRDPYWNYSKIGQGTFHHLRIDGGNLTRISFKPSPYSAVGILNYWMTEMSGRMRAKIANDTLFVNISQLSRSPAERNAIKYRILIGISCPELLSVEGINTNLEISKLKQKNLAIRLSGMSRIEVESDIPEFDSISVSQRDSSKISFEMSEDIRSSGVLRARTINADIRGQSLLDIGHFQIGSLHAAVGDTAGIILSGASLRQFSGSTH